MHGKGENIVIAGEDRGGPIALVYVAIDNGSPAYQTLAPQHANCDRNIIQDAESFATFGKSMMGSASQVATNPILQRGIRRCDRSTHSKKRPAHERFRPGQT
jgi:hypothetical protein